MKKAILGFSFVIAIVGAFAFKSDNLLTTNKATQTVFYKNINPCDKSATCSNTGTVTCVSGISLTAYSDNQATCSGSSSFRFKP